MKKNNRIALIIGIIAFIYLIVDIVHFLMFRINPIYPTLTEAFYESTIISAIKWFLCVVILAGFFLDKKDKMPSFYLIFIPAIGIAVLFILKGQLNYLLRGSIVFKVGLLEITMLLAFIYSTFFQIKKYKIKVLSIILSFLLAVLVFGYLFYQLPVYNAPDNINQ